MRSTGIVRRMDELGRVVISKEIRRAIDVELGDPMDMYMEDGTVHILRYSPDNKLGMTRRIDDLGRVVVPKLYRKQLGIQEGNPVEFFIDGMEIVIRKYTIEVEEVKNTMSEVALWAAVAQYINDNEIGPDDVITREVLEDEMGELVPMGTRCTVMDERELDDVVLQVDSTGREIECDESKIIRLANLL